MPSSLIVHVFKTVVFILVVGILSACGGGSGSKKTAQSPAPESSSVSSSASFRSIASQISSADHSSVSSVTTNSFSSSSISNSFSSSSASVNTAPDIFTFEPVNNAALGATVVSEAITISGIDKPVSVSVTGGEYAVNDGIFTSVSNTVSSGQAIKVRTVASSSANATVYVVLNVGGVTSKFSVTTSGKDYVQGKIINLSNGQPIVDAKIVVDNLSVASAAKGEFLLKNVVVADKRVLITVSKDGFVTQQRIVEKLDLLAIDNFEISLVPIGVSAVINPALESTLEMPDKKIKITFPANSFTDENSIPVTKSVKVSLTYMDPINIPNVMPGNHHILGESESSVLESFIAFNLQVTDVDGKTLKLITPPNYRITPSGMIKSLEFPEELSTYLYDYVTGLWVVQKPLAKNGVTNYSGSLDFTGVIALGRAVDSILVAGCIADENGNPVVGAQVSVKSMDVASYSPFEPSSFSLDVLTDMSGKWAVNASAANIYTVNATAYGGSRIAQQTLYSNGSVSSQDECVIMHKSKISIQLSWEQRPLQVTTTFAPVFSNQSNTTSQFDTYGNIPGKFSINNLVDGEYYFKANIYEPERDAGVSAVKPYVVITIDGVAQEIHSIAEAKNNYVEWTPFKVVVKNGIYSVVSINQWADVDLKNIFYFDYDSSEISELIGIKLKSYFEKYLKGSSISLRIEGHTDERGSRADNMELGQKRADAIANFFKALGVISNIETVTYGEERPVSTNHNYAAWADNNRVEIK